MSPLDHAQKVNRFLMDTSLECGMGFGASICQRTRNLVVSKLDHNAIVRFDFFWGRVWRAIADLDGWSDEIVPFFESLVPSNFFIEDDSEFFAASAIFYSFSVAVDRDSIRDVGYVSEASIALLDNFVYEKNGLMPNAENDLMVHEDPLLLLEVDRQLRDMIICKNSILPKNAIFEMWKTSSGESIIP